MNFKADCIPIAIDFELLDRGLTEYVSWQPESHPMLLCVGSTGSGKSYFLKLLMGKIANHVPDSQLYLLDYKDIDFRDFADCSRRWSYENCIDGLNAFVESFQARLSGTDTTANRKFMIFDEWAAFVVSRDKKAAEEVKSKLSTLLMMGRGAGHHVIIGLQRADAQLFPMGGRDQFGALMALGNLSREQKLMLFPDYREEMTHTNTRGQGYLHLDGEDLKRIIVPSITDFNKLNTAICVGLNR